MQRAFIIVAVLISFQSGNVYSMFGFGSVVQGNYYKGKSNNDLALSQERWRASNYKPGISDSTALGSNKPLERGSSVSGSLLGMAVKQNLANAQYRSRGFELDDHVQKVLNDSNNESSDSDEFPLPVVTEKKKPIMNHKKLSMPQFVLEKKK